MIHREAHRTAVTTAMSELENYVQTKLNELQVTAVRSRDIDAFEQLEQIRREMPHELGEPERDTFSFARLKGQAIVAQSNVAVAEMRVEDFNKSRHFAKFEIDGEQWSLARVDRQQRLAEREIEFHRGTITAYRKREYAGHYKTQ